jgi:hypothetical protein
MKISKGMVLLIDSSRNGRYKAVALQDFDTEKDEWYHVAVEEDEVRGSANVWHKGDEIPCRGSLCTVEIYSDARRWTDKSLGQRPLESAWIRRVCLRGLQRQP